MVALVAKEPSIKNLNILLIDDQLACYGDTCTKKAFGKDVLNSYSGGGNARKLTEEEADQLINNTEAFMAQVKVGYEASVRKEKEVVLFEKMVVKAMPLFKKSPAQFFPMGEYPKMSAFLTFWMKSGMNVRKSMV